ncbi:MAG: immunity protein 58 [Bdellovibrionales bacterium]|nr:immunity protein 58 [Bdellovibrionales bacterium]
MNRWKFAFFVCLFLLMGTNVWWFYVTLDQAVSYTYLGQSYDEKKQVIQELGRLLVNGSKGYSKKDIVHLLRQSRPDALIVEENGLVIYENIEFRFADDKLVAIE